MFRKLICVIVLGIMLLPLAGVTSQDSRELGQTLDSDGSLIIHYPDDWLAAIVVNNRSHSYRLFNTVAASVAFDAGGFEALDAGQMVLEIFPSSEIWGETAQFPPADTLLRLLIGQNFAFDEISKLEIAERPAAIAQFTHRLGKSDLSGLAIATELENEDTIILLAEGRENAVEDANEIILAIAAAVTPHVYDPLALTQVYQDGTITFSFPEGWFKCDCQPSEPVMIIGSKDVPTDSSWQFDSLNGGVLVSIFKDVEQWLLYNGQTSLSAPTPAKIIESYFLSPGVSTRDIVEFDLNGRPAARLRVGRPSAVSPDSFFIIAELETGRFGGLMALKAAGESFFATEATLLAIVDSMAIGLDAQAYFSRAYAYMEQGHYKAAITDLSQAIELDSEFAAAYYFRGMAYDYTGEYTLAIADYSQTIKLEPDVADGYYARGAVYAGEGEYEHAIADFNRAIDLDPVYVSAYYDRGVTHNLMGDYELAIADFNKVIELHPELDFAYRSRGNAYRHLGDYEQAIADYNYAIELQPSDSAYLSRGFTYSLIGNSEQAIADYVQYARLNETEHIERAPLSAGQSIELGVIEGRSYLIPLNTAAGSTISITASTSEGDPLLILFDSHGEALTFNDDIRTDDSNAAITDFSLPAGQDFQLLVTHAGGGSTFIATITLEQK